MTLGVEKLKVDAIRDILASKKANGLLKALA